MPFKLHYYKTDNFSEKKFNRSLFHYTTVQSMESILTNKSIRFRKNNFSNDEKNGKIAQFAIDILDLLSEDICNKEPRKWTSFKKLCTETVNVLEMQTLNKSFDFKNSRFPSMFNFCLSNTNKSKKMWENYAKNQVCIEFSETMFGRILDYPSEVNSRKYFNNSSLDVIYDTNSKLKIVKEILWNAYLEYDLKFGQFNKAKEVEFEDLSVDLMLCAYIFKDFDSWHFEKECRFFLLYHPLINDSPCLGSGNPYIELNFSNNPEIFKAMIKRIWLYDNIFENEIKKLDIEYEVMKLSEISEE